MSRFQSKCNSRLTLILWCPEQPIPKFVQLWRVRTFLESFFFVKVFTHYATLSCRGEQPGHETDLARTFKRYLHFYIFLILITETNNLTYYTFIPIDRC